VYIPPILLCLLILGVVHPFSFMVHPLGRFWCVLVMREGHLMYLLDLVLDGWEEEDCHWGWERVSLPGRGRDSRVTSVFRPCNVLYSRITTKRR
jgi:hypothetical protein